jgi:chaperone required for assembly of F1-ATPase
MSTDAFMSLFGAREAHEPADPMKAAQGSMRPPPPRRFYTTAACAPSDSVFQLLLDGKPARTPAKRPLAVASLRIAEALAAEWNAQTVVLDPASMPLTRLVNSAVDGVADRPAEVRDEIVRYAGSDLICYRAEAPEALASRQAAAWDPLLAWAHDALGARLRPAAGVIHVDQPRASLEAVRAALAGVDDTLELAALGAVTTLTGSAVIALALARGAVAADEAWAAGTLDETYQAEVWGVDEEAAERLVARRREFDVAALVLGR